MKLTLTLLLLVTISAFVGWGNSCDAECGIDRSSSCFCWCGLKSTLVQERYGTNCETHLTTPRCQYESCTTSASTTTCARCYNPIGGGGICYETYTCVPSIGLSWCPCAAY